MSDVKELTGLRLYAMWRERLLFHDAQEPGDWELDLHPAERAAWNDLAQVMNLVLGERGVLPWLK